MFSDEDLGLNTPDSIPEKPTKAQAAKAFLAFKKAADEMDRLKSYRRMTAGMRDDYNANLRKHTAAQTLLDRYFAKEKPKCQPKANARKPSGTKSGSRKPKSANSLPQIPSRSFVPSSASSCQCARGSLDM